MDKKQILSLAHVLTDLWNDTDNAYWSVPDGSVSQFVVGHDCDYFEQLLHSNHVPFPTGEVGSISESDGGWYYLWNL